LKERKKRKWREGVLLLLVLLLTSALLWVGLSGWGRTPHIYAYDEGTDIEKETQLAQNGEEKKETDKDTQETTPPDEQEDSDYEEPEEDSVSSQEKKDGDNDDSQEGEPDEDGDSGEEDGEGAGDGTGDGDGDGDGDSGDGDGVPVTPVTSEPEVVSDTTPTETPIPETTPTEAPESTPEATLSPEDKVVSLSCTWADKDTLVYKKDIPKETIKVTATYSSGQEVELSASEYTIAGLKNDSVGQHTMTVVYGDVMCKLSYKVNNYIKSMTYDWETKDKCYKGEVIDDTTLYVTVVMADESEYDLEDGQYTLSGIDNQKTGVDQTFTITYQDYSVTGTCRFTERTITYIDQYYSGGVLQGTETTMEDSANVTEGFVIEDNGGSMTTYKGTTYELTDIALKVDGKEKTAPYKLKERNFDTQVTRTWEVIE
jgi:hypothetical protein